MQHYTKKTIATFQSSTSSQNSIFFFFNDTATTEIYTLSLHDALPISMAARLATRSSTTARLGTGSVIPRSYRSEEHTSELQSHLNLVCRLLLEKKKKKIAEMQNETEK